MLERIRHLMFGKANPELLSASLMPQEQDRGSNRFLKPLVRLLGAYEIATGAAIAGIGLTLPAESSAPLVLYLTAGLLILKGSVDLVTGRYNYSFPEDN